MFVVFLPPDVTSSRRAPDHTERRARLCVERLEDRLTPVTSVTNLTQGATATAMVQSLLGPGVQASNIIYTGADHSNELIRPNYDLHWMNLETGKKTRITFAPGPDVLPVFSPDYTKLMWTRSPDGRSASQLYIADFTPPKE